MANLPLCRDSQWENRQLCLSVCPRTKKIPHRLVWGEGCCCLSHPSPCHPTAQSRHTVILPSCGASTACCFSCCQGFNISLGISGLCWSEQWKAKVHQIILKLHRYHHQLNSCLSTNPLRKDIEGLENNMHVHRKIFFLLPWPRSGVKKNTRETGRIGTGKYMGVVEKSRLYTRQENYSWANPSRWKYDPCKSATSEKPRVNC